MFKATKIKGGKFSLPWKGLFKIQKIFDNNIMELSTISDEGAEKININKLKTYHHNNPQTNVIIMAIIIDTKYSRKNRNKHERKENLIFHLTCIQNQIIYPGFTQIL
jgi:hypothetical protein